MIPTAAEIDNNNFLPTRFTPIIHRLIQEPPSSLTLITFRSIYFYLQEQLDQFLIDDAPSDVSDGDDDDPSTRAPRDSHDGDDDDPSTPALRDSRDGDDGDPSTPAPRDSHDGDDGDPGAPAPRDSRDGDDGDLSALFGPRGPDGFYTYYPEGFDPGPALVIDDALVYRLYRRRFYFTATDLLVHLRADCFTSGRDDISARLTPSSIGHELKRLGLPFRRTGQRRLYSLTFPFIIWLLDLYRTYQLSSAGYLAATPAPHPLDAFTL